MQYTLLILFLLIVLGTNRLLRRLSQSERSERRILRARANALQRVNGHLTLHPYEQYPEMYDPLLFENVSEQDTSQLYVGEPLGGRSSRSRKRKLDEFYFQST